MGKIIAAPRVSITFNPYQGLKPDITIREKLALIVSITFNPYQGLKHRQTPNGAKGFLSQLPLIPIRD